MMAPPAGAAAFPLLIPPMGVVLPAAAMAPGGGGAGFLLAGPAPRGRFGANAPPGFAPQPPAAGGAPAPILLPPVSERAWMYRDAEGAVHGPHSVAEFRTWAQSMQAMPRELSAFAGMRAWVGARGEGQAVRMSALL